MQVRQWVKSIDVLVVLDLRPWNGQLRICI